ncbi:unnamed protein product, partial [Cylicocyclus nassatus]
KISKSTFCPDTAFNVFNFKHTHSSSSTSSFPNISLIFKHRVSASVGMFEMGSFADEDMFMQGGGANAGTLMFSAPFRWNLLTSSEFQEQSPAFLLHYK